MTPATTRKYKEKGSHLGHGEIREEQQHSTRTWKKDKGVLGENVRNATDEEHGWEEGEIAERVMWARWRSKLR